MDEQWRSSGICAAVPPGKPHCPSGQAAIALRANRTESPAETVTVRSVQTGTMSDESPRSIGRVVGLAFLALLDALAAGALAALAAWFLVPVVWVSTRLELSAIAGGLVTGVVLAIALALAGLGRRPFPATRLAKGAIDRVPYWI
jgi:hypothetical protein